jgi:hypothetical protein
LAASKGSIHGTDAKRIAEIIEQCNAAADAAAYAAADAAAHAAAHATAHSAAA